MRRFGFILLFAGFLGTTWQTTRYHEVTLDAVNEQLLRLGKRPTYDFEDVYSAVKRATSATWNRSVYWCWLSGFATFAGGLCAAFGLVESKGQTKPAQLNAAVDGGRARQFQSDTLGPPPLS